MTIRALASTRTGGPETLEIVELQSPVPGPGEVCVAVEACGVNYPDVLIIQDLYQFKAERPFAPGCEIAGRIVAVGPGVTKHKVGERVTGGSIWGGMAEQIVLDANKCFPVPEAMPREIAAAFYLTYGTSLHALRDRAQLKAGETLLVLGAAGGVGIAAVELGKAFGARVIAGVSSEQKAQVAREHGADEVVIYPTGELDRAAAKKFTQEIKALTTGERGADVIYDAVGGSYAEPALRAIAWEGRYLVVGFPSGIPKIPLNLLLLKGCSAVGVFWGEFINRHPDRNAQCVADLIKMIERGQIKPLVSKTFPLERGGEAIAMLASRQAVGKIVVTVDPA